MSITLQISTCSLSTFRYSVVLLLLLLAVDKIRTEFLKKSICITYIITRCKEEDMCPEAFKMFIVILVYQSSDSVSVGNYRPITLINHLSKVFEKPLKID